MSPRPLLVTRAEATMVVRVVKLIVVVAVVLVVVVVFVAHVRANYFVHCSDLRKL
jgi:hypothetical protein